MTTNPRRFQLHRHHDVTGASGTGVVADGCLWPDGTASVRWRGGRKSIVHWDSIEDAEAIHGHGGHTEIVWLDPADSDPLRVLDEIETAPRYELAPGCPHCPDGHTPPDHGQPWAAWVTDQRDGDGQPTAIHIARTGGSHVAESDAEWIRRRLNGQD